jgi:hypothetical protein
LHPRNKLLYRDLIPIQKLIYNGISAAGTASYS